MKKHLFLDLEETVINSIEKMELMTVEIQDIKNLIKRFHFTEFGIFSFAIDTAEDVAKLLDSKLVTRLESEFSTTCTSIKHTSFLRRQTLICSGCNFDLFEFKSVWGKERAFIDHAEREDEGGLWVLIDDAVKTKHIATPNKNGGVKHILLINVNDIGSAWVQNVLTNMV